MMGSTLKLIGAAVLAGIVVLGAGRAVAFQITQAIPNGSTTACTDVAGADTAANTPVEAYPCSGLFNEQWSLTGGHLQGIGTVNGSAECLEAGASKTQTFPLVLNNCAQTWQMVNIGAQPIFLFANSLGYCLDSRGIYGAGAQLVVDVCNTVATQYWVLAGVLIEQPIAHQTGEACVDVRGAATANHTAADAFPCTLGFNERWNYVNGQLQGIGTTKGVSTCLGETTGGKVELQTCSTSHNQLWEILSNGTIWNWGTFKCLDSQGQYGDVQLTDTACLVGSTHTVSQTWVLR